MSSSEIAAPRPDVVESGTPSKTRFPRWLRALLSLIVVGGIFFFALPRFADFSRVWASLRAMTWLETATLVAAALWNLVTYWFVMMSALPGSNVWQSMKVNQISTAVSNTLPGGGAIGIGVTYGLYTAYGFGRQEIGLSILVTGIWNNFVKLGMPIIAVALLAVTGGASSALTTAAIVGVIVLAVAVALFALALKSERAARKIGDASGRAVSRIRRVLRKEPVTAWGDSLVKFRSNVLHLLRRRWLPLTLATLVSHVSLFLVLLIALRHVGVGSAVTWIEALAAFAFLRLVSALPVTPGGLGVVELGLTAALVAAGGPKAEVVAAVLVYRVLTYGLPIPIGGLVYLQWRRHSEARRKRAEAAHPETVAAK